MMMLLKKMMMMMMMIKLSQKYMKKTLAILSLVSGLFFSGCSEFEVVDLEDPNLEAFIKTYPTESPEVADYLFNDILLAPYFLQSIEGYKKGNIESYDLRLQIFAKTKGKELEVVRASIPQLNIETALKVNIKTERFWDSSGLFIKHKLLISEISGTDLYEAGSEGRTVDVVITAQVGDETKTFDYSFSATKTKVAVPIR